MKDLLNQMVAHPVGVLIVLSLAAFLEAYGDSCFQSGLYRSSGANRALSFAAGAATLAFYGLLVNAPRWEFGRLLGVYVVLFFVVAQVVAKVRFDQRPTAPVLLGGALLLAGGAVMSFWNP